MVEVLVAPDVEGVVAGFLRSGLSDRGRAGTVATRVPEIMPARMVRVSLTGGSRRDVVTDRPQVTVECWESSSVEASATARLCEGLLFSAAGSSVGGVWVRRVESVGGVQFFPDPDTNSPRYQFTVRLDVRPSPV